MRTANAFTLLEVVVVLALLGLVLGIATLALVSLRPPRQVHWVAALDSARTAAVRSGVPVRLARTLADTSHSTLPTHWLILPDGRVLGPHVDGLTGVPRDAR